MRKIKEVFLKLAMQTKNIDEKLNVKNVKILDSFNPNFESSVVIKGKGAPPLWDCLGPSAQPGSSPV